MKRWQILNAEPENYSGKAVEILRTAGNVRLAQQDRASLLAALADVEALIVRLAFQVDEQVLAAAPRLRAIVTATTG